MNKTAEMTSRTRVRRMSERANYDLTAIFATIDKALYGTIAFQDGEHIHAIPTAIWREDEHLYIHGSNGSRLLKVLQTGTQACVSITNMEGMVLARSAFHHSMNYTAVCIYGAFTVVPETEKNQHLQHFLEHWLPGRWQHVRAPDKTELAATTIMRIPLTEAVMKSRQGPPRDDLGDMDLPVWAGIMPLHLQWQTPQQVVEQQNQNLPGRAVRDI